MKVDIGLIITERHLLNIENLELELGSEYDYKLHYYIIKNNNNITKVYQQHYNEVDAFIFSGPVLYEILEKEMDTIDKLCYIIEDDLTNIYKQLLTIAIKNPELDFSRVYIDFIDERIESDFNDIFEKNKFPYYMPWDLGDPYLSMEKVLNNHIELWNQKKIDLSITRFGMLLDRLAEEGVRCKFITPSYNYLKKLFSEAIEEVRMEKLNKNKIGLIYIEILNKGLVNLSDHELELIYLESLREIIKYTKKFDFVINPKKSHIEITTTIEEMLKFTNNLESSNLQNYLENILDKKIAIGYGSGKNFSQAKESATIALIHAKESGYSSSVYVGENQRILRNLSNEEVITCIREPNYKMIELSKRLDISVTHLQKMTDYCSRMGKNKMFSGELAKQLGVTDRTANRTLNRIVEKGGANTTEEKRNSGKGRPIKYYILNFIDLNGELIYD